MVVIVTALGEGADGHAAIIAPIRCNHEWHGQANQIVLASAVAARPRGQSAVARGAPGAPRAWVGQGDHRGHLAPSRISARTFFNYLPHQRAASRYGPSDLAAELAAEFVAGVGGPTRPVFCGLLPNSFPGGAPSSVTFLP